MQIPVLDPIFFTVDPYTVELRDIRRPEMKAAALGNYVLTQMLELWTEDLDDPVEGFAAGLFLNGTLIGSGAFYSIEVVNQDPLEVSGDVLLATPQNPEVAATLMAGIDGYQGSYDGNPIIFRLK